MDKYKMIKEIMNSDLKEETKKRIDWRINGATNNNQLSNAAIKSTLANNIYW